MVIWMGQAFETHRLNPLAPTFTSQALAETVCPAWWCARTNALAEAIDGLPGVVVRPNQRTLGILLDRMGVIMVVRTYRRNTRELEAVLPEWKEKAKQELSREREILFPGLTSHSNITR